MGNEKVKDETNQETRRNGEGANNSATFDVIDFEALHHNRLDESFRH